MAGNRGGRTIAIRLEPALDGTLGVDAVESDPHGRKFTALRRTANRLRVQAEQLCELACLVVPLDHEEEVGKVTKMIGERVA